MGSCPDAPGSFTTTRPDHGETYRNGLRYQHEASASLLIEDIAMQTDSFERDQEPHEEDEYLQLQQRAEHRQGQELEGSHVIGRSQVTEVLVDISKDGDPPAPSQGVAAGYTVLVKTAVDPLYHHGGEEKTESSKGEVCFIGNLPVNAVGSEYIAAHGSKFKKADTPSQGQPRTGRKAALNGTGVKVVHFSMVARKARAAHGSMVSSSK